jgi:hypothetical protein
MACNCSDPSCAMQIYISNGTGNPALGGGQMTLQNVTLDEFAPCVRHNIPNDGQTHCAATAYLWDNGSIAYNMANGTVLEISYTSGNLDDINAVFNPPSQVYYAAKSAYANGFLITVRNQHSNEKSA